MSVPYLGDYTEDATVYIMFNTFTSDDPSASSTITNFINTDVHIHKNNSLTQRNNAAGITVSVDFDGITGSHMIVIDTSDDTVAGFWVAGADYFVRIEGTTIDAATVNAVVAHFSIENRFNEVDVTKILGHLLTNTGTQLADAFQNFFDVAAPTGTVNSLPAAAPDAAGGLPISDAGGLDLDNALKEGLFADGVVWVDPTGTDSTAWPYGSASFPTSTIANGKTIADAKKIQRINITGTISLLAAMENYELTGSGNIDTAELVDINSQSIEHSTLRNLTVTGIGGNGATIADQTRYINCLLYNHTNIIGVVEGGSLGGACSLVDTGYALFTDVFFGQGAACTLTVQAPTVANIINMRGTVTISGMDGGILNITLTDGSFVTIDNTCTGGTITLTGIGSVTDNNGGTTVVALADTPTVLHAASNAKLLSYVQLLARSDAAIETDNAAELTEINADGGSGAGNFSSQTDAIEAIRDRGDTEWITATGFSTHTAANVVDEFETQSQADPTGFHVNVMEVGGTAQTANDNGADINAILVDTNELQTDLTNGGRLDLIFDELTTQGDTNESKIDVVDGIVDNILVDTAVIGALGAGLTAIPWNAAWDAEVQSEVQDAIEANHLDHIFAATYDPAAKPGVADALLNELVENDGGVSRYTANALEQAPSGGTNPNVLVDTTITVTSQTEFTLTAGSNDNDAYLDQAIVLYDASDSDYPSIRVITAYVGASKTVTIDSAPDFTIVTGDGAKIFVTAPGTVAPTAAAIVNEWEAQSQADPTGFHVNVKEVNGTAQTAGDIPASITTAQADLDILTGADGVTLATLQGNYAPNVVVPDVAGTAAGLHATTDGLVNTAQADLDILTGADGVTLATLQGNYAPNVVVPDAAGVAAGLHATTDGLINTAQADLDILTGADGVTLATLQANYAPNIVVPDVAGTAAGLHATTDGKIDAVKVDTAAILVDSNELQTDLTNGGRLDLLIDAILADTGELQTDLVNGGRLDLLIDAILADTGELQTDWVNGGRLDLLIDSIITAIAALNDLSAADINAQVLDVLNVDTFAEPGQGSPAATTTLAEKIGYIYKFMRNKITTTATTISVYNDAGAVVDQKSTHSDDATTYTRGEFTTGP